MAHTGLNKAILIGEVADPPKLKILPNGTPNLTLRLHTSESIPDEDGTLRERKAWITVVVWGKRGEALHKIIGKGWRLAVDGRIVNRSWEDVTGRHYATEIYANDVVILDTEKRDAA
jgi:single-strand DNA-binding protein